MSAMLPHRSSLRIFCLVCLALLDEAASYVLLVDRSMPAYAADDAVAQQSEYSQGVAAHYNMTFGAGKPFLPSNATTDNGEFIDPKSFPTAEYCGHCHQQAYAEWRQSVHANAFRNPWYVKNVNMLISERGIEYTRHCEGCHNPIALTSGALTKGSPIKRNFDDDGITCSTCHAIQKVNTRGTGSYEMGVPAVLVDADGKPI